MTTTTPTKIDSPPSALRQLAWTVFFYAFGVFNWCLYLGLALKSGSFFKKDTEQDQLRFAIGSSIVGTTV